MQDALHRSIVYADTERSGGLDDHARTQLREHIHFVFTASLAAVKVTRGAYTKEDRGDGLLITVESSVAEAVLAGRWIIELNEALRQLNRGKRNPLRMRLGLNSGPVRRDRYGVSGRAVDTAARLANCDEARKTLAAMPGASLAVFVGNAYYHTHIREGGAYIEAEHYRPIAARTDGLGSVIWAYTPRIGLPPESVEGIDSGGAIPGDDTNDDPGSNGSGSNDPGSNGTESASGRIASAPSPQQVNYIGRVTAQSAIFGINNAPGFRESGRG